MLRQLASFPGRRASVESGTTEWKSIITTQLDHAQPRALPAHLTFTIPTYGESHLGAWGASGL